MLKLVLLIQLISLATVALLIRKQSKESKIMNQRLVDELEENTSVVSSAVALLNSLAQEIRDNAEDEDAINAIADRLDANTNALAQAVAANTPAEEDDTTGEDSQTGEDTQAGGDETTAA
jgi:HD superfamily phosphodiesterase